MKINKKTNKQMRVLNDTLNDAASVGFGGYTSTYAADSDMAVFNRLGAEGLISNAWTYLALRFVKDSLYKRVCTSRPNVGLIGRFRFSSSSLDRARLNDFHKRLEKDGIFVNTKDAVIKARNFGGGALFIMGRNSELPLSDRYDLLNDRIEIKTTSLHRWQLFGNVISDKKLRLQNTDKKVDASRLVIFRNEVADFPYDRYTMGWGTSIAEHTLDSINKYYKAINKPMDYLDDAKVEVYKIEELASQVMEQGEDGKDAIRERISLISENKAKNRFIMIDSEDDVQFKTYSFGGLSDLIDKMFEVLMMELEETRTSLLGEQTSGLSNSDSAMDSYFLKIEKWREMFKPQYYKIFEIMYKHYYGEIDEKGEVKGGLPADFTFEFPNMQPNVKKTITPEVIISATDKEIYSKEQAKEILEEIRENEKE